jgi:Dolichyl-phosphate-mannose-protein mannosyltransferase
MEFISIQSKEPAAIELEPKEGAKKSSFIWREALLPFLGTRLMILLVGLMANYYILPLFKPDPLLPSVSANTRWPDALWLMWQHFDSGFYLDIAKNGYWDVTVVTSQSNWIFHPLYPILIAVFGHLFGSSDAAFSIASLFVSNGAAFAAIIYLYLLVRNEFGSPIAARTVFYLALFPTSFYLSATFSESVFLVCALACIYYARRRQWWIAGICGGLASLARIQGVLLFLPVLWEYWQVLADRYVPLPEDIRSKTLLEQAYAWLYSRTRSIVLGARNWRNWTSLVGVMMVPLGIIPFFTYAKFRTGDFLEPIHAHSQGWGRGFEYPWRTMINALLHPTAISAFEWDFWPLNIVMVFVFLGFTVWAFRRLPGIYAIYTFVMVVMPLCTGSINSISRYYLIVFPAMILLALWSMSSKEHEAVRNFWVTGIFTMLLAVFTVFFVLGLPLIA